MQRNHLPNAELYAKQNRRRRIWQKIVGTLACAVVFCTTYALILPAITQERETFCGYKAHAHEESCYVQTSLTKTLICTPEEPCVHAHSALCYDQNGELICQLPEVAQHEHTDSCYVPAETEAPVLHAHSDACYTQEQGDLICQLEEKEGHTHGASCYTTGDLTCTIPENHTHGDGCYESSLTCGQTEGEEHTHEDACYTSSLICTVTEGHVHDTACYASVLICETVEETGHTHGNDCYTWNSVLTCGMEEGEAEPVPEKDPILVCTEPVLEEHVHSDSCFETVADNTLTCTLEEGESHTHTALCYGTWELVCELEEHEHKLTCYSDPEADLETAEIWEATFADVELTGEWYQDVLLIAESQLGYSESVKNYVVWEDGSTHGYTRYGEWYGIPHGDWCGMFVSFCLNYAGVEGMPLNFGVRPWIEDLTELELYHEAAGYDPIPGELIFFDWEGDGLSDHVGLFVEIVEATDTEPAKIKTIEGNSSNCVQYVTYDLDSKVILGYSGLPEQLTESEKVEVDHVIKLIDEMPSADEIDANIEEFEEAEDYEGEEAWLTEVYQQVAEAYFYYDRLSDVQKYFVTNADKLLELDYIWSMTTYAATNTIPVYQINSYYPISSTDPSAYAVIMLRGGSFDELCQKEGMLDFPFNYWNAIVVEEDANGNLYIAEYDPSTEDKSTYEASTTNGFVLIFTNDSTHEFYLSSLDIKEGDYASVDFAYTSYTSGSKAEYNDTTGEPYGYVTFSTSVPPDDPTGANPVTTVTSASTSDFIELNLYDYYGDARASAAGKSDINNMWDITPDTKDSYGKVTAINKDTVKKEYPGFQWNGGAYPYKYYTGYSTTITGDSYLVDRDIVDNIDFGNSMITDYKYVAPSSYGNKAASAQMAAYSNSEGWGRINRIEVDTSTSGYGINCRPIGMSTLYTAGYTFNEVLTRTLYNGYPQLAALQNNASTNNGSLEYLFSDNAYAKKINSSSIDGLFQYNETTGEYSFNSRENHAQYNPGTNTFTLYNQIITPNFILYPFGNFLPFNDITQAATATNVGAYNYSPVWAPGSGNGDYNYSTWAPIKSGGASVYLERIINRLSDSDPTEKQLKYMLNSYKKNWTIYSEKNETFTTWHNGGYGYSGKFWKELSTSDLIDDFFNLTANKEPSLAAVDSASWTFKNGQNLLDNMYNIDFDVEKDFFFGMEMKMNFYQPKNGMTGKDTNGDGSFDYPMYFYFTGDDDVWVYIDDALFLDLSGIHRHVGGKIDFVNGRVYYFYLDVDTNGDVTDINDTSLGTSYVPYGTTNRYYTFAELLTAAGKNPADYLKTDASGNYTTFLDYSTHSFKFYYMERGSGSSVCRLNFNFPLIQQNTIAVEKALESDVEVLGDPDFTFQVVDKATGNPFFAEHDDVEKLAYSLYEGDTVLQRVRIVDKNPDGTIKTLEVYQGNIRLLREVDGNLTHYNDDGTVREDGTPNPKLLTTDENGYFTLKAGQRAEFVGIAEHWGEYYVREILPDSLDEQYDEITITGETSTTTSEKVPIGSTEFVGADSTVQNSNASNSFRFTNSINEELLGSLSIAKEVDATYTKDTSKEYEFNVTLDGELLPENLAYTVAKSDGETETRNVYYVYLDSDGNEVTNPDSTADLTPVSRIKLKHGETATISNILAGTTFEVTETTESAKGYTVSYSVGTATNSTSAKGVVGVNETVAVMVTNSEIGTYVDIPIAKTMSRFGSASRTYQFTIEQVADQNGTALNPAGYLGTVTLDEPTSGYTKYTFKINYTQNDVPTNESKTFYYKVSEVEGTAAVRYDTKYYIVKVDVTNTNDVMKAEVTDIWQVDGTTTTHTAGADLSDTTILFTNTILRNLIVSKKVTGTTNVDREFAFTLTLVKYDSNAELPTALVGTKTDASGNTSKASYPLVDGVATFKLKNGESVKFTNIPYRSKWTLTETAEDGYLTTYTITANNETTKYTGNTVEDQLASASNTTVAFTNAVTYELPQTGGTGTHMYTMAGLMLVLISTTYLLYRSKKRRREVA